MSSFYGDLQALSKNGKYFLLSQDADGHDTVCSIVEMETGCIISKSEDLCVLGWSKKESASSSGGNPWKDYPVSHFDPRSSLEASKAFESLKKLNSSRTEKLCNLKPAKSAAKGKKGNLPQDSGQRARHGPKPNFQQILATSINEYRIQDLSSIGTKSIAEVEKDRIAETNDINFYMDKNHLYAGAIDLLNKVIIADSERVPAYLNLGDALWNSNNKVEANKNYAHPCAKNEKIREGK